MGYDVKYSLENYMALIKGEIGEKSPIVIKHILLGTGTPVEAILIYVNGLADKTIIDRDVLNPLLLSINENLSGKPDLVGYLSKKYIAMSNTDVQNNLNEAIINIKRGNAVIFINNVKEFLIIDTRGGMYRQITDPFIESASRGPRESFVENLEANMSMVRRYIKDKNLVFERFTLGQRTQTDVLVVYLKDVADDNVVNEVKERIRVIDADRTNAAGIIEQYTEDSTYSIFPQVNITERVDKTCSHILEGRVCLLIEGAPNVMTAPAIFTEFFHAVEDYYDRTIVANFVRLIRFLAIFIIITASPLYLVFIKFNSELIPVNFILPIIESRRGIALSPLLEIILMEIVMEFLREGGLRLPSKIAQTLSVVGGIIVGDTATKSKFVSPTTLFVIGISVVATFVIVNYEMSLALRFLRFPMLILADLLGVFGITIGWFILLVHLLSLDSFGVPYLTVNTGFQDKFLRSPLWKMNNRGEGIPHKDNIRQKDFRVKWRKKKNEKGWSK
ncbi:spore germination protein [Candidatus Clostridium stratigraminis]|uniref:Spore germination protein n=1 Tax=Candidatus Clostridium stratigraminis TaxID=3381661 RepID=A0ABW8T8C8_9CLOT